MAIKDKKDVSVLLEAQIPEFVTSEHPKFKYFIEKYYEFMESQQVYFTGFTFNEDRLVLDSTDGSGYVGSCLTQTLSRINCNLKVLSGSSSSRALYGFFRVKINNY